MALLAPITWHPCLREPHLPPSSVAEVVHLSYRALPKARTGKANVPVTKFPLANQRVLSSA